MNPYPYKRSKTMAKKIFYEWGFEEAESEDGEEGNSDFSDILSQLDTSGNGELVLVRNSGSESMGLEDRLWAYVKDGNLPENFEDASGEETGIKVPERFHKELLKAKITTP
jgi:hypothetical protein